MSQIKFDKLLFDDIGQIILEWQFLTYFLKWSPIK